MWTTSVAVFAASRKTHWPLPSSISARRATSCRDETTDANSLLYAYFIEWNVLFLLPLLSWAHSHNWAGCLRFPKTATQVRSHCTYLYKNDLCHHPLSGWDACVFSLSVYRTEFAGATGFP